MKEEAKPWYGVLEVVIRGAVPLMLVLLLALAMPIQAAEERKVIPVGRAVGIKLFSDGVVVVGTSEVDTEQGQVNPAKACGLKEGDIITHINATEVDSIEEISAILQQLEGEPMSIRAIRREQPIQFTARAVLCSADGAYKLGAWIRDSMAGIGTVTFYDPDTGMFGALGHGINDVDTALLMPLEQGSILSASVAGVQRGKAGKPGVLHGVFDTEHVLGILNANTTGGIFGLSEGTGWGEGEALPLAKAEEIRTGTAYILSNVEGDRVEQYAVEISRLRPHEKGDLRDCLITVTDERLLERTGGIVQGMSGSPILQNGKLVGAVTHVLVNDPTRGYGIFIENMLEAAG